MKKHLLSALILGIFTLSVSGCARHAQIIIDPKGVDMRAYYADLAECQQLADQVEEKVAGGVVGGAVVGAIFGGIVGGRRTAATTGALGAVAGGLGAGGEEQYTREKVLRNCLRNRGYQILN